MSPSRNRLAVYVETGSKRTVASALDWPGWYRFARDEQTALQSLVECGERYARLVRPTHLDIQIPATVSDIAVVERLKGNATTDMGAPAIAPSVDAQPVSPEDLKRLQTILKACWRAFDAAARKAEGRELTKGPRGGGRDLDRIVQHVLGAEEAYLGAFGWKVQSNNERDVRKKLQRSRKAIFEGLDASTRGEIPSRGPRGGLRWSPRYFVRRVAYHVVDHTWEIEDRVV